MKKDQAYTYKCGMTVAFVLIVVSYPLHILMNNSLPLDCAFVLSEANETDISTINLNNTNITTATSMSNQVGNSITRFVISAVTFITLTTISTLFGCAYVTKLLESQSSRNCNIREKFICQTSGRVSKDGLVFREMNRLCFKVIFSMGVGTRGARGALAPLLKKVWGLSPPALLQPTGDRQLY